MNPESFWSSDVLEGIEGLSVRSLYEPEKSSDFRAIEGLGHSITPLKPALCPIKTKEDFSDVQGLRCKVSAKAYNGEDFYEDKGELLFKEDGISGIIVFQISSIFARSNFGYVTFDFFPDMSEEEL